MYELLLSGTLLCLFIKTQLKSLPTAEFLKFKILIKILYYSASDKYNICSKSEILKSKNNPLEILNIVCLGFSPGFNIFTFTF